MPRLLFALVKKAVDEGKCYDPAMKELKLPKYESLANYGAYLAGKIERYCDYWNRGI